ncbi:MAG: YhdP family protein [Rhodocyclaceae bacterium]|nr:YhdP family protein [Rhodocyclaceae bacterium]
MWRIAAWTLAAAWFAFAILVLSLRYIVLPHIQDYRQDVAALLSDSLGLKVDISGISAGWRGLQPDLRLAGMQIYDRQGRPALAFDSVEAELSWSSLWHANLVLARLEIAAPSLSVRREADGRLYIAGILLNTEAEGTGFSDWLLAQQRIVIRDARIAWSDARRGAPTLDLSHVNLLLENSGRHHRFGFTAEPPPGMAARLDIRGDLRGRDMTRLTEWQGQVYAATAFADLAVWRQWLDYPLQLPQGSGAMRLWLDVGQGRLVSVGGDLALSNVRLRLARDLPELNLLRLAGRLSVALPEAGFEAVAKGLSLETKEGITLAPTDFTVRFTPPSQGLIRSNPGQGEISANVLDLDALRGLASYLPLDAVSAKRLNDYAPRGRLADLRVAWQGDKNGVASYKLSSRFERLGMAALEGIPGFEGFTGSVDGTDKDGTVLLDSRDAALDLPAVFPERRLALNHVKAKLGWKAEGKGLLLDLKNLSFQNHDAEGFASGTYRHTPGAAGSIDLSAQLTRGEGKAVWRYMPLAVNKDTHDWLREGILGGGSRETKLRLKGDLKDFPFVDGKSGIFRVTVKFSGATLHYAPAWPDFQDISGDLLFEGKRMLIHADRAKLYGVTLSNVVAELPDLMAGNEVMRISGRAAGPTKDFLRFIEESPVSDRIEHFTEGMAADGGGNLQLSLVLPLRHLQDSTVRGDYQFVNNRLTPDPDLPPITEINGRLQFTGDAVTVKNATGHILGGPLSLSAGTRSDGAVAVTAQGSLSVAQLRHTLDWPLLENLSGTANWRGNIAIRHRNADLVLESSLVGIASSLPEPFNKSAAEAQPLRLERQQVPVTARDGAKRDTLRASYGRALSLQLQRRQEGGKSVVENGAVALQSPPRGAKTAPVLPIPAKSGVAVVASLDKLNLDFWRHALTSGNGNGNGNGAGESGFSLSTLDLKTGELTAFGRNFPELELHASGQDGSWQAKLLSRDVAGDLSWNSRGKGRLQARLRQLALGEAREGALQAAQEPLQQLPALDVQVENFSLRGLELGKLELDAVNRGGIWQMRRIALTNPEAKLTGSGEWRTQSSSGPALHAAGTNTQLAFKLETGNVGKLLERLGYPGTVKNGSAKLEGDLAWTGPPTNVDYPSLQGKLTVDASRGQFAKLNPGAGRLLGILSLQSLPRRIGLDFGDIFSQGFAFDSIAGDVQVGHGVFASQNLRIQGPAADILMSGDADVLRETQNLLVRVRPAVGESLSVGAMFINPAVGVATYLAQKLLKDPLGQVLEFDYRVTGAWGDPKVEKVARAPAAAKPEQPKPAEKGGDAP